jgi:hypothetical protein
MTEGRQKKNLLHKAGLTKWGKKTKKSDTLPLQNDKKAKIDHHTPKLNKLFVETYFKENLLTKYRIL